MKLFFVVVLFFSSICSADSLNGLPRKYSNCPVLGKIITPEGSAGHFIDSSCQIVYVLPPVKGGIEIESYVDYLNDNSFVCKTDNSRTTSENDDLIKTNLDLIAVKSKKLDQLQLRITQNDKSCSGAELDQSEYENEYLNCMNDIKNISDSIALNEEKLKSASSSQSILIAKQIENLQYRKKFLENSLMIKKQKLDRMNSELMICTKTRIKSESELKSEYAQIKESMDKLNDDNSKLLVSNRIAFENMKATEGGIMTFSLISEQNDMVKKYKAMNSEFKNIEFQQMPLSGANLSFSVVKNGIKNGYPVINDATLSGIQLNPDNSLERIPFKDEEGGQNVVFGSAIGGKATINQFASCLLPHSNKYGNASDSNPQYLKKIAGTMNGTMTYRYQLAVSRNLKMNYNEKQLYCLIKKHSSSNGLFRTSSSSSITESLESSQWLSITIDSEDSGFDFQNRENLAMELRKEYLDRALMKASKSYLSDERADIIAPPEAGAPRISKALSGCKHLYCQAGSVLLDLGNAIFGGSSSSASTCQNVGSSSVVSIKDTKPVYAYGTQSFTLKTGN
jgi:hypothetical protein